MTPPKTATTHASTAVVRNATADDAAGVWALVAADGTLDPNSPYAYLLALRHHGPTSVVAEDEGRIVGFVLAYRPPQQPDTVFVWQVGVAASHRRRGLGRDLLHGALGSEACAEVRFMEATVTPSNDASMSLFSRVAFDLGAEIEVSECFRSDHFPPGADHEREDLIRIGPIPDAARPATRRPSVHPTEESAP